MGKAAPAPLHMKFVLLPNVELFWEIAQLPAQHPRTQGQLKPNPTMGAPTDPGEPAGEGSSMVWGAGRSGVVTEAHSNCQAGGKKGRGAACGPRELELFQGCCQLCCKKLLLAGALHSLMGLVYLFFLSMATTDASLAAGAQDSCIPREGVMPRGIPWPFLVSASPQGPLSQLPRTDMQDRCPRTLLLHHSSQWTDTAFPGHGNNKPLMPCAPCLLLPAHRHWYHWRWQSSLPACAHK